MKKQYDIAAYIWPAYTGDEPRARIFWEKGIGEWQTVQTAQAKFEGHSWPRKPLWGYLNEADPQVMARQIEAATEYGVNVFIYDWYWYDHRPFLENCLNTGFLQAENRNQMKFFLMWANHNAAVLWDKRNSDDEDTYVWDGAVDRVEFEKICHRLIEKYFSQPNYYTIDKKPVFMIYDINNLMRGLGGMKKTKKAFEWFRQECVKAGLPGLYLMGTKWGEINHNAAGCDGGITVTTNMVFNELGFDGMTHYQFVHFTDMNRDYLDIMKDVKKEWAKIDNDYSLTYYPHISIGWDNNPRFFSFRTEICRNNTPENISLALKEAKKYADEKELNPPLITVNSWNEWTETSYLQPDNINGYGYLQAIKDVFSGE